MDEKKRTLRGFLCAALGGVCWGASGTVGQYLFTRQGLDSGWLTVVRMFLAGVVLLVLTQAWRIPVALNAAVALGTLEISVVGTALAFTLYLQGVSDVGGVRASLLACTEPVSAALCAALWLHTSFAWQDLLGFAAILVMAVLIALPERASEKSTEKAEN